jgi:parvulin-like peptidyl-prolyl isomerase
VRCLAIVMDNQRRAQQVFEMARKKNTSENFGKLAEEYSVEPGSKAMRGEVPPIKKHGGQPKLEEEAFALKPGELSGVIQVADKFIILRCEEYTKPTSNIAFATVRDDIHEDLHEKKLRLAMADRFEELQESAIVDNYLEGTSHTPQEKKVPTFKQVPGK